jgi:hypothetical protein
MSSWRGPWILSCKFSYMCSTLHSRKTADRTLSFIMWLVTFAMLCDLAGSHACSSRWYRNYWGRYWGRLYLRPGVTSESPGCGNLRAVLAFTAINWILFMFSAVIVRPILPQVVTCDIDRKTGNLPICKRMSVREYLRISQWPVSLGVSLVSFLR